MAGIDWSARNWSEDTLVVVSTGNTGICGTQVIVGTHDGVGLAGTVRLAGSWIAWIWLSTLVVGEIAYCNTGIVEASVVGASISIIAENWLNITISCGGVAKLWETSIGFITRLWRMRTNSTRTHIDGARIGVITVYWNGIASSISYVTELWEAEIAFVAWLGRMRTNSTRTNIDGTRVRVITIDRSYYTRPVRNQTGSWEAKIGVNTINWGIAA